MMESFLLRSITAREWVKPTSALGSPRYPCRARSGRFDRDLAEERLVPGIHLPYDFIERWAVQLPAMGSIVHQESWPVGADGRLRDPGIVALTVVQGKVEDANGVRK